MSQWRRTLLLSDVLADAVSQRGRALCGVDKRNYGGPRQGKRPKEGGGGVRVRHGATAINENINIQEHTSTESIMSLADTRTSIRVCTSRIHKCVQRKWISPQSEKNSARKTLVYVRAYTRTHTYSHTHR